MKANIHQRLSRSVSVTTRISSSLSRSGVKLRQARAGHLLWLLTGLTTTTVSHSQRDLSSGAAQSQQRRAERWRNGGGARSVLTKKSPQVCLAPSARAKILTSGLL